MDWRAWVLDHGLPSLPSELALGDSVPVARWVEPDRGAVLRIEWFDEGHALSVGADVALLERDGDGWVELGAGAGGWPGAALARPVVQPRQAVLGSCFEVWSRERGLVAVHGWAGTAAATVEREDDEGVVARPVDSPVGAVVACGDRYRPMTVRVRDAAGAVLDEYRHEPPPRSRPG